MIYFIMPVGSDPEYARKRRTLKGILDRNGRVGHFPLEQLPYCEFDLKHTIEDMAAAEQIIADLALERPSCYFEIGLAQGAGRDVLLIAPEGAAIHQVAGRGRVRYYKGQRGYELLMESLISSFPKRGSSD
jgi:hypothetical protein